MSISLDVEISHFISISALIEGITDCLHRLLNDAVVPQLKINQLVVGVMQPVHEYDVIGEIEALYALSFVGYEDQVLVTTIQDEESRNVCFSVSVGKTREATEYVLGLSTALALALVENSVIEDGFGFWTGDTVFTPSFILGHFTLKGQSGNSFERACAALVGSRLD
jgi:hypothetical protein